MSSATGFVRPAITFRWWVQFFGHIPFVAVPIVAMGRPKA
jgi:hypothetical protein